MKRIAEEEKKFHLFLARRNKKLSLAKKIIFEMAMKCHGHFTVEDLLKRLRKQHKKVSRATVYRIIHDLLEAGVIRETAYGEKHNFYEHLYDEQAHFHARCIYCHTLIEFPALDINPKYKQFLKKKGFHALGHELHFYGICQKCRKQP